MALALRRISLLAMTVVILVTTVGFACLLFATAAMGMPADHGMPNCGAPAESVAACPHQHPVTAARASSDQVPQDVAVVQADDTVLRDGATTISPCDSGLAPEAPLAHLTPLRI